MKLTDLPSQSAAPPPPVPDQAYVEQAGRFEECLSTLRTHILLQARSSSRVYLVTSARPGEGKSTIAANLAASIARTKRRVLLVDADLRRPTLHDAFGISNRTGLSNVLTGDVGLESTYRQSNDRLWILPSGSVPLDPQALLVSARFGEAMAEMRAAFDVVIVDSPPVLTVTDAALLSRDVDGMLIVMRAGTATMSDGRLVRERLEQYGARLIGCVLTHFAGPVCISYHPYAYNGKES